MKKQENKFRKLGKEESIEEYCAEEESWKVLSKLSKDDLIERYMYRMERQLYIIMILFGMLAPSIILIVFLYLK